MTKNNIYIKYIFKDKNTDQPIYQLTVRNRSGKDKQIDLTIRELQEKYCLSAQEIAIESNFYN